MAEQKRRRTSAPAGRGRKAAETPADPKVQERELREELFKLRFQHATRQLTNTARVRQVRRAIARAKTRQRQLELAAQAGEQAGA